jgi:ATP-binding cassette subfamily F protein uup
MSGGERRRLQLLQVLARAPNVLLLDEPSNDLDLSTLTALEEYLTEVFDGCLVVVSHDNFFVNRVAEHLFVFEGDGVVRDFEGSYTDYLEYRRDCAQDAKEEALQAKRDIAASKNDNNNSKKNEFNEVKANAKAIEAAVVESKASDNNSGSSSAGNKMSYNERKEFNKIEKEIQKLDLLIIEFEEKLDKASSSGQGYSALAELTEKMNASIMQKELKEQRWMELADDSE